MALVTTASTNRSPPSDGGEPFSSPLLRELFSGFDSATRHVILVPGAINSEFLALLHGKRSRLLVADAALALSELDESSLDTEMLASRVEKLVIDAGPELIDTVLCWDLLNYMSPPLLQAFCVRLSAIMSPAGRLHAYIHSASAQMPQVPQRYALLGDERVVRVTSDPAVRKTPRYSYGDLERHATAFSVARSMLLRNGIQEYLLQMRPA